MKLNKWTVGLAAAGLVSLPLVVVQAEEKANPVMTALSSTTISGYVDTSAHWNFGTGNANPAPYIYNQGKSDGFNLDRVKVRLDKGLGEENWAAGYRVDLLFGPDANEFGSTSLLGGDSSDLAIQQAYVALRAPVGNGIDFKMGVFDSIIGYESQDTPNNPNYTRSYAASWEPRSHTGLLATYQINKMFGIAGGVADTMMPTINARSTRAESAKTYMGSVAVTAPDDWGFLSGSTLYAGAVDGFNNNAEEDQSNIYVGATLATPIKGVKVGAAFDYVDNQDINGVNVGDSRSYAGYLSFQPEGSKWGFHVRGEYAEAYQALFNQAFLTTPNQGQFDVFALTGTIEYDLWKNVLTRLELRWDHVADASGHQFGGETPGTPSLKNSYLLAANVIYKF